MFPPLRDTAFPLQLYLRCALSLALLLTVLTTARAQGGVDYTGTGGKHTIQGRIYFPSGQRVDTQTIKVKLENPSFSTLTVFTDRNGAFSFKNLTGGSYTIVAEVGDDYEAARETVYIDDMSARSGSTGITLNSAPRTFTVAIHLRPKLNRTEAQPGVPGVIDATLASVPEEARQLYEKALALARNDQSKEAIEQLKKAVALYPEFPLALNELGVQYLKLAQVHQAIDVLRAALKIAPEAFSPRLNYGIALLQNKQFAEAENQLRQALKKRESSPTAHLYLGMTLIQLKRLEEAEKELQRAVKLGDAEVSLAHYYLGGIYWGWRKYREAADELEMYLRLTPQAANAEQVRHTIKELRSKQ